MNNLSIFGDLATSFDGGLTTNPTYYDGLSIISVLSGSFSNLLSLVSFVLIIIGTWKILEKAGEQGWKSLIPFYNSYTLYKVFWEVKMFWISLIPVGIMIFGIFSMVFSLILSFTRSNYYSSSLSPSIFNGMTGVLLCFMLLLGGGIFSFVMKVLLNNRISKAFGKTAGFTVGLVLLPPVFYMILGCGKDKYQKAKE